MREQFRKLAYTTAEVVGSPWAFLVGVFVVLVWGLSGPFFHFSDTWQLVINTGTTIATFLVVFLIQSAQNRDARALHLKLDELLRAVEHARTSLVALESRTDEELDRVQQQFNTQWATLGWAAANKRGVLTSYYQIWADAVAEGRAGALEPNEVVQPANEVQFPVPDITIRSYFLMPSRQLALPRPTATCSGSKVGRKRYGP